MVKKLQGLYDTTTYRVWKITAPYATEKYIFAGSKRDADAAAKKVFKNWMYKPKVREIKTI